MKTLMFDEALPDIWCEKREGARLSNGNLKVEADSSRRFRPELGIINDE
jgi:hypothetical protein